MVAFIPAVDPTRVGRTVGIRVDYQNLRGGAPATLPIRIGVLGQGNDSATYGLTKRQVFSAEEVGEVEGYGSPLYLAVQRLLPTNGDGVGTIPVTVYPLENAAGGTVAVGEIDPTVTTAELAEYQVKVNNILCQKFTVAAGDLEAVILASLKASIDATLGAPIDTGVVVTELPVTAKWKGPSGDDIYIEILGPTDKGITWGITHPTGGTVGPDADDINAALAQVGNIWETFFVSCSNISDDVALDTYQTFAVGRWDPLVKKPCLFFTGNAEQVLATATTVTDARATDYNNVQLPNPGSNDLPMIIAARDIAKIAPWAQADPAFDYGYQQATGLGLAADGDQWTDTQMEFAVTHGSSTVKVIDNVVNLFDTVTMYHPSGDPLPPYRFVVDQVKIWNVIYNLDLRFSVPDWAGGAPMLPNATPATNPNVKKPKMATAIIAAMIDGLSGAGILANPVDAKKTIIADINTENPKRMDIRFTAAIGGNTNITSINYFFGFQFGIPAVVG